MEGNQFFLKCLLDSFQPSFCIIKHTMWLQTQAIYACRDISFKYFHLKFTIGHQKLFIFNTFLMIPISYQ